MALIAYMPLRASAYSVLTHQALVDANWEKFILPLLKQQYPDSSANAFSEAHAYAYGGAVIPDMGYYPYSNKLFTDLVHYVRTGDFIETILEESQNLNEYAFALGVLCHYYADRYGHQMGINVAVPMIYPKMKQRYGDTVTYAMDHISHIRTEFSFDVLQTARGNYASSSYHHFIGFKIADSVLARAFRRTYSLELTDLFKNFRKSVGVFRWTVTNLFPFITRTAWARKKHDIKKVNPEATASSFIYRMHIKNYNHQFSKEDRPGFFSTLLSLVLRFIPKIGPLRPLHFKEPTPGAEKLFVQSFDTVSTHYITVLTRLQEKDVILANINFDTGDPVKAGMYAPADEAYNSLVIKLNENDLSKVSPSLKQNIADFYKDRLTPVEKNARKQKALEAGLSKIRE
ncbi:MAG: hypothetical protein JWN76_1810 [Chitinophagaceae bacterium]|nr:hypothetical protein [Chitinophagaceae bacterium]